MCSSLSIAVPVGVLQCSFLSSGTCLSLLKLANGCEASKLFSCGGSTFSSPSPYGSNLFGVVEEE